MRDERVYLTHMIDAIRAVEAAGFTEKRDFFWVLHSCFVSRPEQARVFSQIFRLYWRDPRYMEHMMSLMLPAIRGVQEERSAKAAEKRAAEALLDRELAKLGTPDADVEALAAQLEGAIRLDAADPLVLDVAGDDRGEHAAQVGSEFVRRLTRAQ